MALDELMLSVGIQCEGHASTPRRCQMGFPIVPVASFLTAHAGAQRTRSAESARGKGVTKPLVLLAADADVPMTVRAMKTGAVHFFTKPLRP